MIGWTGWRKISTRYVKCIYDLMQEVDLLIFICNKVEISILSKLIYSTWEFH